jgi:hypothetical protein
LVFRFQAGEDIFGHHDSKFDSFQFVPLQQVVKSMYSAQIAAKMVVGSINLDIYYDRLEQEPNTMDDPYTDMLQV